MPLVALVVLSPSGQFLPVSLSCPMAVHVNLSPSRKRVCHKNQVVPAANHIYIKKKKRINFKSSELCKVNINSYWFTASNYIGKVNKLQPQVTKV